MPAPTQEDIDWLKSHPDGRADFDAHFGDGTAKKYIGDGSSKQTRLAAFNEATKGLSTLQKFGIAPQRLNAALADIGSELFNPLNWVESAGAVGDVASRIPDIVSKPENLKEVARGAVQGVLATPGAINDLALAGVDKFGQIAFGNTPLSAKDYADNPVGSATTAGMFEDWGNKATDAAGLGQPFDFSDSGTEEKRTARQLGAFGATGAVMGGAKALLPAATGAIGAEAARKVAPDEPGWQVFGGAIGAGIPSAAARAGSRIAAGAKTAADFVRSAARPFTEAGREIVVGNLLKEAAGEQPADLQNNPLSTVQPTLGQQTNNPGILALEKTVAKSSPTDIGAFKNRLMEGHDAARGAIADLRGPGSPNDMREVADQALQIADQASADALTRASTGRTPAQASDAARARIDASREAFRATRQAAWRDTNLQSDAAMVEVDPLRSQLREAINGLGKFYGNAMPADVQDALQRLNPREPLSELQDVRSAIGDRARDARAANDSKMARVYETISDTIGNYLDNQEFADPNIQGSYQHARALSRLEAQLYKQPDEMRATLGRGRFGGQATTPGETLGKFIKPGPAGRDALRQLLAVDDTPEMRNIVGDYYAAHMPDGLRPAQTFMTRHADALGEIPVIRDRLQQVVDARAAAEALRNSPLSIFAGVEPDVAVQRILAHPDRISVIRRLRARPEIQNRPGAWDGVRAAYVNEILRQVDSVIERGVDGNPTIKPGVMNKFYRENADVTREILGPVGDQTLGNVADAVEMLTRTSRGGYPGGSDTFSMLSGDRFVDHIIEKYLMHPGAPYALAGGGFAKGGPIGAAVGLGAGYVGQTAFATAKAQVAALLRDALLDPAKGRALMLKATPQSLQAAPRPLIPYLRPFTVK